MVAVGVALVRPAAAMPGLVTPGTT